MLSGKTEIQITPSSFSVPRAGRDTLSVTVSDEHGHLIEGGSSIDFAVSPGEILGSAQVTVEDGMGDVDPYQVILFNSDSTSAGPCVFTVSVTSVNGNADASVVGTME